MKEMRSRLFYTLYQWQRHRMLSWTLARWAFFLLLSMAFLSFLGLLPGGRNAAVGWLGLALAGRLIFAWAKGQRYVLFVPHVRDEKPFGLLSPGMQIPVRVTGRFAVGEREQDVVAANGYVERFGSGEWVVAAIVPPSRYGMVGTLPWEFEGMWYQFFTLQDITAQRLGHLHVQGQRQPALEIRYRQAGRARQLYLSGKEQVLLNLYRSLTDGG